MSYYRSCSKMTTSLQCRLCMATVSIKNSVALFSPVAVSQKLAARVASLLETTVDANDRLPHHLCKPCKRRFDTLEKAAEDLKSFRTEASECRRSLLARSVSGKRTKESSGSIGISPDTMKERPHPKRHQVLSRRQLDFGEGEEALCNRFNYV